MDGREADRNHDITPEQADEEFDELQKITKLGDKFLAKCELEADNVVKGLTRLEVSALTAMFHSWVDCALCAAYNKRIIRQDGGGLD